MKKVLRVMCSLIFVFSLAIIVGCKGCSSKIHPVSIQSWDLPKATYELGEYLDLTGSTIKVEYSDGSTEDHEVTYDMVSVYDLLNVYGSTGKHSLQVTYAEGDNKVTFETEITVTVQAFRTNAIAEINAYKNATASIFSEDNTIRIEELKLIARSAIYAAADENEVAEILAKTKASIDTVLTAAEESASENAAKALKAELVAMINEAKNQIATINTNVQTALGNLVTTEQAETIAAQATAELTTKVATLESAIESIGSQTGTPGENGKQVLLQVANNKIQWKYDGDATWTDLIGLDSLKGPKGADGAAGKDGAAGADGNDGDDGRGISAISLTTDNKLKFEFDNGDTPVEIDLAAVLTPAIELQNAITKLQNDLAYQLDADNTDSLQAQINKVAADLATLDAYVQGLDIQDTFDGLQEQIDEIVTFFTNSGVDLSDSTANATKVLESILANYVEEFSTNYLDRTYSMDEFKDLLINTYLPELKGMYGAAKLIKTIGKNCYGIILDDSLSAKEKLNGIIDELRDYDEILITMGVDEETVAKIQTKLQGLKAELLETIKTKLVAYIDVLSDKLEAMYNLDNLLAAAGNNATLLSYQAELELFLTDIGYNGAATYENAINNIKSSVEQLTYRNGVGLLKTIVNEIFNLVQIDSLNDVLPALLGAMIEEYYNLYVGPLADYLSNDEVVAIAKAKDQYLMTILRTKSAVNAINYAATAKDAIANAVMNTSLGSQVLALKEKMDEVDYTTAKTLLNDLDTNLINIANSGVYGGVILAQVEAQYIANYTSRFSILYYAYYSNLRDTDPTFEAYGYSDDYLFDHYVQPQVAIEVFAAMSDASTVASISADVLNVLRPLISVSVDTMYKQLFGVSYNIHEFLAAY